ncbi:MAG TPA: hypothetical protein PLY87_00030 [Planctomycetaceae bacterium]|nr:hypothetical protein [Planctomycetaceae bacterium]HQZ63423.1 hypothetical protein [Planctomycetaceae bacterium]
MMNRRFWLALTVTTVASCLVAVVGIVKLSSGDPTLWGLLVAAALGPGSLLIFWPRAGDAQREAVTFRARLSLEQQNLNEQQEVFDRMRQSLRADIESRAERLDERERDLATRFARFHEFLEYPLEDVHTEKTSGELQKLSEQDRAVQKLLETEAERVYEKIRRNGYTVNGKVDLSTIRDEAMQLIKQVARIYKPTSQHPLLETSFEQLARAASRICLHVLVLLEQLPVSVQHYNAGMLYGYMQKAVASYGVYQKAGPWMTYLSRGLYAGRLLSTTNPAALGAWWLATELGKRGAQKVVENVIDRQAIATLHGLVTVIGVEVAGIYGTGFRQRDTGWIFGAELVELVHSFPMSGESLRHGLREITVLRLRSEYDRIYLYRCLADHRSVGMHLADPAMLTREEREAIARQLEAFFNRYVHGATEVNLKKWREGFERRFDLRLKLEAVRTVKSEAQHSEVQEALNSLASFLQSAAGLSVTAAIHALDGMKIPALIAEADRTAAIAEACRDTAGASFEPPVLDPGSEVTNDFLKDLATGCTFSEKPASHLEELAGEIGRYFRRPAQDMHNALEAAWLSRAKQFASSPHACDHFGPDVARAFLELRDEDEQIVFCYGDLSRKTAESAEPLPGCWLLGLERPDQSGRRAIVTECGREPQIIWESGCPLKTTRIQGLFLDDAKISSGRWLKASVAGQEPDALVISGSLRGGRFRTYFRDLLSF